MNNEKVQIRRLRTGVSGLDEVLGGGLPEYSFTLIMGTPGAGKTTLSQQIMFANASPDHPALHFTILGEPPLKLLRYQQQFDFFHLGEVGRSVLYHDLREEALRGNLEEVVDTILGEVERSNPGVVVVESFHTLLRPGAPYATRQKEHDALLQRLSLHLAAREATSFLVGEFPDSEMWHNPVFTVADGIIALYQEREGDSVVRALRAIKLRGSALILGMHPFEITDRGVRVSPRTHQREG